MFIVLAAQVTPTSSPLYNIKRGTDFVRSLWGSDKEARQPADDTIEEINHETPALQTELPYIPQKESEKNSRK